MVEVTRVFKIESNLDSYQEFFDSEWREEFLRIVRGTQLQAPAFDLVRNWEAASHARSFPWLMVKSVETLLTERLEQYEPADYKKIRFLHDNLVECLQNKGETVRPMLRKKLHTCMTELDDRATRVLGNVKRDSAAFIPDAWNDLLGYQQFGASIWSLERMCYGALYYNYEWLLTEGMRIKRRSPDYRISRHDDFKRDFRADFGQPLQQSCWSDQRVVIARLTRHALVHNGGRLTKDLGKQPHGFPIEGDEVQVGASHTTALYECLKDKVRDFATVAVTLPEFR